MSFLLLLKKLEDTFRLGVLWLCLLLRVPAADVRLLPLVIRAAGRAVGLSVVDVAGFHAGGPNVLVQAFQPLA
jgi:hypothetical protein